MQRGEAGHYGATGEDPEAYPPKLRGLRLSYRRRVSSDGLGPWFEAWKLRNPDPELGMCSLCRSRKVPSQDCRSPQSQKARSVGVCTECYDESATPTMRAPPASAELCEACGVDRIARGASASVLRARRERMCLACYIQAHRRPDSSPR